MVFCFVRSLLASNFIFVYCDFCDGLDLSSSVLVSNLGGEPWGDGGVSDDFGNDDPSLRPAATMREQQRLFVEAVLETQRLSGVTRHRPRQRWAWPWMHFTPWTCKVCTVLVLCRLSELSELGSMYVTIRLVYVFPGGDIFPFLYFWNLYMLCYM
jgi:hypothetical protein